MNKKDRKSLLHNSDLRKDYFVKTDSPTGPHKVLPPNQTFKGRVGPIAEYKKIVHYPDNEKYTIKTLDMTKLGGRCPVTGRKIIGGVGGGAKRRWRWIDYQRMPGHCEEDEYVERVIAICYDPNRNAMIALTGHGAHVRWQIATAGLEEGQLIRTSNVIPDNPVKPIEHNSYPLGALPIGTEVCLVQPKLDSTDYVMFQEAKSYGKILRKMPPSASDETGRVIITDSHNKKKKQREFNIDERCLCVVGRVSIHPLRDGHI